MCVESTTTTSCADLAEQAEEAIALLGIESGGRLVHDDEARVSDQRLRDPEALAHAAREGRRGVACARPRGW